MQKEKAYWQHFPHQADIGIRGVGETKAQAFVQAAMAMTAVIVEPEKVAPSQKIKITCQADDDDTLFLDWLSAILYEMDTRQMLFGKFEVVITGQKIEAYIWGEKCDIQRHQPAVEIKGATYTALSVKQQTDGWWVAQCVVDV